MAVALGGILGTIVSIPISLFVALKKLYVESIEENNKLNRKISELEKEPPIIVLISGRFIESTKLSFRLEKDFYVWFNIHADDKNYFKNFSVIITFHNQKIKEVFNKFIKNKYTRLKFSPINV